MTKIKNWIRTHKTESIVIAASTVIFAAGAAIGFSIGDSIAIDRANKKLNNFAIMNPIKLTSGKVLSVDETRFLYAYALTTLDYAVKNKKIADDEWSTIGDITSKATSITKFDLQ